MPCALELLLLCAALAAPPRAAAAQADRRENIQTLTQAVAGEKKKDPETWFRLGIEYNRAGDIGQARAAFKQALKLRPKFTRARAGLAYTFFAEKNFAEAEKEAYRAVLDRENSGDFNPDGILAVIRTQRYRNAALKDLAAADEALSQNPSAAEWYLYKAEALIGLSIPEAEIPPDLSSPAPPGPPPDAAARKAAREEARRRDKEAADCLEKYLDMARPAVNEAFLREQLEALRFYAQASGDAPEADRLYAGSDVSTKAVIWQRPEPGFTTEARKANLGGMVRLRATLAADGRVNHVLVIIPLRHGLTELAVKAAKGIRFNPATVNGVPVSQQAVLEYNFAVY